MGSTPKTDRTLLHEALTGGGSIARAWGQKVELVRRARHMSRRTLATLSDCRTETIFKVEKGSLAPSDHLKVRVAAALDMPAHSLFPLPSILEVNELFLVDIEDAA